MAKLTWLGEDSLHMIVKENGETIEGAGPSFTTWKGVKFPKNEPVEVNDPAVIAKAKINPFFKVEDGEPKAEQKRGPGRPPKVKEPETVDDNQNPQ